MRQLVTDEATTPNICMAIHCLMNVAPLVNYLTSTLLEADLTKKRVNAVAFTRGLAVVAKLYWQKPAVATIDVNVPVSYFRKVHRNVYISGAVAVQQMYQIIQDAVGMENNFCKELGGCWVVHEPGCKHDSVQQLINGTDILQSLPHVFFVKIDRGDRTKRFINYGTSVKVVKTLANNKYIMHKYQLSSVLIESADEAIVYAKNEKAWEQAPLDGCITEVQNLNSIVSIKAQVLCFLKDV